MDTVLIALAGFLGGLLNAVAGGGSFFTLSALIFVGVPPVIANATGTTALLPGYLASSWRFRREINLPKGMSYLGVFIIAISGGTIGALLLVRSDEALFAQLIPWLILLATLAFVVGPKLLSNIKTSSEVSPNKAHPLKIKSLLPQCALFCVCIYGGYFNGGLGIIILAALGFMGQVDLKGMNGLKNIISALLTAVAVIIYWMSGSIDTEHLLLLSVSAVVGGYIGAVIAYRIPQNYLRGFIVCVGLALSFSFFNS